MLRDKPLTTLTLAFNEAATISYTPICPTRPRCALRLNPERA
ncbi:hypothetical protein ACWEOZ_12085 [Actinoplanes sp. NPDC004185]